MLHFVDLLESRFFLSVPKIAGRWEGSFWRSVGDSSERGHIVMNFKQLGATRQKVVCTDVLSNSPDTDYCRGTIDSRGHLQLQFSTKPTFRKIFASGTGQLRAGNINFSLSGKTLGGDTFTGRMRISRAQ
jgi:hypothetical protein